MHVTPGGRPILVTCVQPGLERFQQSMMLRQLIQVDQLDAFNVIEYAHSERAESSNQKLWAAKCESSLPSGRSCDKLAL